MPCDISEADKNSLLKLQAVLVRGGQYWNEVELENKFISPLVMLAEIDDGTMGYNFYYIVVQNVLEFQA